jgi:uncharacterized protein (TIGR02145 family)
MMMSAVFAWGQHSGDTTIAQTLPGLTIGATATFTDPRDKKTYKVVRMGDGKIWFAQNLNYTKDLHYNAQANQANNAVFISLANGAPAVGSYWCPAISGEVNSGSQKVCDTYGALYTWETAMMVDGKYADETKKRNAWDESWVSKNYFSGTMPVATPHAAKNNARGAMIKGGGRGICPPGWHVPTELDWALLLDAAESTISDEYGESTVVNNWIGRDAGVQLKSAATYAGEDPGNGAWRKHRHQGTNNTGFGVVPSGYRFQDGWKFYNRGATAYYWSASAFSPSRAWIRGFGFNYAEGYHHSEYRAAGCSVRCVRD